MRSLPLAAAALLAAVPAAGQEGSGYVQTEEGTRVELRGGRTVFATMKATPTSTPPATPPPNANAIAPPPPTEVPTPTQIPPPDPCRAARSAYLRQLLRATGVEEVDDPLALLEGLAGPQGYDASLLYTRYGLLPGVDPIRPLAWDFELQRLARELVRCGRSAR